MSRERAFTSWLTPSFDRFVALRRASGAQYLSQRDLLLAFDRYLAEHASEPPLQRQTLIHYLASLDRLSPRGRDNVVAVTWSAVAFALRHGVPGDSLPPRPPRVSRYWRQRPPRILTATEVRALLAAARALPPAGSLRPATTATLLGLLHASGLRIGEALALDVGDFDRDSQILTVRRGKFGKSRALPLRESTAQAMVRYVEHRSRPVGTAPSDPLFVSGLGRRLAAPTVWEAFQQVIRAAGIPEPRPRLHDFRHSFAVHRLAAWYAEGRDLSPLLPLLSTYLGHVSVQNTRLYLSANGALLEYAARRFAQQTKALDEVQP